MPYAAEFQQVLERFAGEIDDLRTIARLHGLPTGAPEHLLTLPLRLAQDARLRSDLTELVRSLQAKDSELGLPDVLSLLLAGIGGSPNLERRRDLEECVDLTGGFLASLGGWPGSAVEPTIDIDNPPDHDPRLDLAASAYAEAVEEDLSRLARHKEEVVATSPLSEQNEEASRDPNGAVTLAEITHALARLERGNLELRLHLDSIDQRICRMEPLLETAPHPEPPEPPLREPRRSLPADPVDLIHRGSASPLRSNAMPQRDRYDEVKTLRRISLTSNFAEPPSLPSRAPSPAPAPVSRATAPSTPADHPGSTADPVSHPRMQPRRDRFAAAREIPGNSAETDPLYTAPEEDSTPQAAPRRPTIVEETASAPPTAVPIAAPVPADTPVHPAPEAHVEEVHLPTTPPASGSRERLFRSEISTSDAATTPLFSDLLSSSSTATEEDPHRSRTKTWAAGLVAAGVIGAAGFLYLNGLPSFVNEWVSGSATTASATPGVDSPPSTEGSETAKAATTTSSVEKGALSDSRSTKPPARVLGARESFNPTASVEKTNGPTFVPGGIMDGYLIAAPRPVYPEMAKLVGAEGKVTFEAMVSREGQVEAVKVLGGPQVLRSAATDAVKQWQYRPFQVKGRPVEVRTIIRVDVGSHTGSPASTE